MDSILCVYLPYFIDWTGLLATVSLFPYLFPLRLFEI